MLHRLTFLYIFIMPLWPTYGGIKLSSLPIINPQRLLSFLLLACLIFNCLLSRRWFNNMIARLKQMKGIVSILALYFFWRLLTAFFSIKLGYSIFIVSMDILLQFVPFIIVIVVLKNKQDINKLLNVLIVSAIFVVAFGFFESFSKHNLFFSFAPSGSSDIAYIASAISEKFREAYRVQVAFLHPLVLAEYLVIVIPLAFMYSFVLSTSKPFSLVSSFVFFGGICVLYFTGSRSGIIALAIQVAFYCFYLIRNKFKLSRGIKSTFVFVLALVILTAFSMTAYQFAPTLILGRDSTETSSTFVRLIQLYDGINVVKHNPMVGLGPGIGGSFAASENPVTGMTSLDNFYLNLTLESGIPALILFILIFWKFIRYSLQITASNVPPYNIVSQFLFLSLIGHAIFCFVLSIYELFPLIFALFGIILVMRNEQIKYSDNISSI